MFTFFVFSGVVHRCRFVPNNCKRYEVLNFLSFVFLILFIFYSDVEFRMCDINTLFYFAREKEKQDYQERKGTIEKFKPRTPMPSRFELIHNFRTHAQILNLSTTCVKLLENLFPASIEKLNYDEGCFDGPTPILLTLSPEELQVLFPFFLLLSLILVLSFVLFPVVYIILFYLFPFFFCNIFFLCFTRCALLSLPLRLQGLTLAQPMR